MGLVLLLVENKASPREASQQPLCRIRAIGLTVTEAVINLLHVLTAGS